MVFHQQTSGISEYLHGLSAVSDIRDNITYIEAPPSWSTSLGVKPHCISRTLQADLFESEKNYWIVRFQLEYDAERK
jgi:hypothetical protein